MEALTAFAAEDISADVFKELRQMKQELYEVKQILLNLRDPDRMISVKEAAEIVGFSERWVYRRIENGELNSKKMGRARRLYLSEIRQAVSN